MPNAGAYRRHSPEFKLRVCSDIRSGRVGRREAQRAWRLSPKLLQVWLGRYDRGELDAQPSGPARARADA